MGIDDEEFLDFDMNAGSVLQGLLDMTRRTPKPELMPDERSLSQKHRDQEAAQKRRIEAAEHRWRADIASLEESISEEEARLEVMRQTGRKEEGTRRMLAARAIRSQLKTLDDLRQELHTARESARSDIYGLHQQLATIQGEHHRSMLPGPDQDLHAPVAQAELNADDVNAAFGYGNHPASEVEFIEISQAQVIETEASARQAESLEPSTFEESYSELETAVRRLGLARKRLIQIYHSSGDPTIKLILESNEDRYKSIKAGYLDIKRVYDDKRLVGPSFVPLPLRQHLTEMFRHDDPHPLQKKKPAQLHRENLKLNEYVPSMNRYTAAADGLRKEFVEATEPQDGFKAFSENVHEVYSEDRLESEDFQDRMRRGVPRDARGEDRLSTSTTVGDKRRAPPAFREGGPPEGNVLTKLDKKQVQRVTLSDLTLRNSEGLAHDIGDSPITDLSDEEGD